MIEQRRLRYSWVAQPPHPAVALGCFCSCLSSIMHSVSFIESTPSPARAFAGTPASAMSSSPLGAGSSPGLLDRIMERKRAALGDRSNVDSLDGSTRRQRPRLCPFTPTPATEDLSEEKVAVQRFTLVSRGAPPAKRKELAKNEVLQAPPRVAAQLGTDIQVCRCSECDRTGLRRRVSGTRLCRRDTESHPEYALLLMMSERFEGECLSRSGGNTLVTDACCREKTAFFILGAGNTTVGYVAAELAANRRVRRDQASIDSALEAPEDKVPTLLQVYVEPEFRRRGYATEALRLLTSEHATLRVEIPTLPIMRSLENLGFKALAGDGEARESEDGLPLVTFVKSTAALDVM